MRIIDAHCHVARSLTVDQALKWLDSTGFEKVACFSQSPNRQGAEVRQSVRHIAQVARKSDGRVIPFAWLDPTYRQVKSVLTEAVEKLGVVGVKIIPDGWMPYDPPCMRLYEQIAEFDLPLMFHSGILWSYGDTSRFCRPANYECLMQFPTLRFSLAHIGWPWVDECLAVVGKIRETRRRRGVRGEQCYVDCTPGTPPLWRRDALKKALYYVSADVMFFGTDGRPGGDTKWPRSVAQRDKKLLAALRVTRADQGAYFAGNFERFLTYSLND
jgi:predicted TIM-barrel fold metal-dependent hydrolase